MGKYKKGDTVFVVEQRNWRQMRSELPAKAYYAEIEKVGRKYAYIERGRFSMESGESNHPSYTTRLNGGGFDVYDTEQTYLQKSNIEGEYRRLKKRFQCVYRFPVLEPETVAAIHRALDDDGGC